MLRKSWRIGVHMALKEPESMAECLYYSKRALAPGLGNATAWALRKHCPKCKKGLMGKPKKTATEYVCKQCGFAEELATHEADVILSIQYVCPFCSHKGETTSPYKRKSLYGKPAYIFTCEKCKEKLGIYKKLNTPKAFLEKLGVKNAVEETEAPDEE